MNWHQNEENARRLFGTPLTSHKVKKWRGVYVVSQLNYTRPGQQLWWKVGSSVSKKNTDGLATRLVNYRQCWGDPKQFFVHFAILVDYEGDLQTEIQAIKSIESKILSATNVEGKVFNVNRQNHKDYQPGHSEWRKLTPPALKSILYNFLLANKQWHWLVVFGGTGWMFYNLRMLVKLGRSVMDRPVGHKIKPQLGSDGVFHIFSSKAIPAAAGVKRNNMGRKLKNQIIEQTPPIPWSAATIINHVFQKAGRATQSRSVNPLYYLVNFGRSGKTWLHHDTLAGLPLGGVYKNISEKFVQYRSTAGLTGRLNTPLVRGVPTEIKGDSVRSMRSAVIKMALNDDIQMKNAVSKITRVGPIKAQALYGVVKAGLEDKTNGKQQLILSDKNGQKGHSFAAFRGQITAINQPTWHKIWQEVAQAREWFATSEGKKWAAKKKRSITAQQ